MKNHIILSFFHSMLIFFLITDVVVAQTATPSTFKLEEATIASVHEAITTKQLTCEALVNTYLRRIRDYNLDVSRGAPLNAIVNLTSNVLEQAREQDRYFQQTEKLLGSLHCIPILLKDNIDTWDSPSSSGSLALLGSQPNKDAYLVKNLRQAGAIILGKASMDEFASGMSGYSSLTGRTGNAYDPRKNSGGSSSGVAVAVSANFAMLGIGTDNSGSIRVPAVFNGVYGLRPSMGVVSQDGIFPRGNLDGVAGPIARNVTDLGILFSVIAGPNDHTYHSVRDKKALQGARIGLVRQVGEIDPYAGSTPESRQLFQHAVDQLTAAGAVVIDNIKITEFNPDRRHNMAGEVEEINAYLARFPSTRKNYKDICTSGRTMLSGGEKGCLSHIQSTANKGSAAYQSVLAIFEANRQRLQNVMQNYHLTALLMPINAAGAASYEVEHVNTWRAPLSSSSGLPAITLIAGYTKDETPMPVGMEFIGSLHGETQLLDLAYAYEQATPARRQPQFGRAVTAKVNSDLALDQLNNLYVLIGYETFYRVFQKGNTDIISAEQFTLIVEDVMKHYEEANVFSRVE